MSREPKKPIEELLEATAKTRRAQFGADRNMPNPMRAQLHQEIERVARGDESRQSGRWFQHLWPRLAFPAAFGLITVSLATLWWWHEHPSSSAGRIKLAMQQPPREAPPPEKVFEQGAAAAAAPAAPTFANSSAAAAKSAEAAEDTDALGRFAETSIVPGTVPRTEGLRPGENKTDQSFLADKSLPAKEARKEEPAAATLAKSRQITNFRQQYSRNAVDPTFRGKLKQTSNILNEFQLEQTDHEIRIVDADGSIYSGKLERLAQNDARSVYNQKKDSNAPASRASQRFDKKVQSATAEYYFRASGYNTRRKKSLEIEGNYIASTVAQKDPAKIKTESRERSEESSARITGVAKIDGEFPVQIDAVAVPQ